MVCMGRACWAKKVPTTSGILTIQIAQLSVHTGCQDDEWTTAAAYISVHTHSSGSLFQGLWIMSRVQLNETVILLWNVYRISRDSFLCFEYPKFETPGIFLVWNFLTEMKICKLYVANYIMVGRISKISSSNFKLSWIMVDYFMKSAAPS